MQTINLELNSKPKSDGRSAILVRLTINRKKARYNPNLYIRKADFNSKAKFGGWVRSSHQLYDRLNTRLKKEIQNLDSFTEEYLEAKPDASAKDVLAAYKIKDSKTSSWLNYFPAIIQRYKAVKKYRYSIRLNAIFNKLKDYFNGKDVELGKTNIDLMKGFEEYLYRIGNSINTVAVNLKVIKQVYRQAIREGLVDAPNMQVLEYPTPVKEVERDKLIEKEVNSINQLVLEEDSMQWHARNYFMFAFYLAGMRFGDLVTLRWSNIVEGGFLRYRMSKTQKIQKLKIIKQARDILDLYRTGIDKPTDFVFPLLPAAFDGMPAEAQIKLINAKNSLVNKYLKQLAIEAEIPKRISFHVARHSFAYIGFKKTKDAVAIQGALQHTKLKETQDYIRSLANDQDRDILGEIFES